MPQDFYQEDEAEEILRLATRQGVSGGVSREALLRMAGEVGLSTDAVEAAERQFSAEREDISLAEEFRRKQRADYLESIASFIGTNAFMVGIWYFTGRAFFWPAFVILGTGINVVSKIPEHFFSAGTAYQKAFARWKAKREKRLNPTQQLEDSNPS